MLRKFLTEIRYRHFWRKATYSELSGFYVAELLRAMALNLATLFIYAFLFVKGYSLIYIAIFSVYSQLMMLIFSILSVYLIAYFGANRCLLTSNFIYIPALLSFSMLDQWGEWAIAWGGLFMAFSTVLHNTSYNVLFSEIKSSNNCGKELGYMIIFQKLAGIVTPLIGGLLASRFGAEISMWVATGLFIVAAISLLNAQAVAKKHHYLNFHGFPWRAYMSMIIGQFGRGFNVVTVNFWPFYMMLFVVPTIGAYQLIGSVGSLSAAVMFVMAFGLGRLLDRYPHYGVWFFRWGVVLESVIMAVRLFITSMLGVVLSEVGYSVANLVYLMPYSKARFDAADKSGSRVVMELAMIFAWNFSSLVASIVLLACLIYIPDTKQALMTFFTIASAMFLIFATSQFPMFRKARLR